MDVETGDENVCPVSEPSTASLPVSSGLIGLPVAHSVSCELNKSSPAFYISSNDLEKSLGVTNLEVAVAKDQQLNKSLHKGPDAAEPEIKPKLLADLSIAMKKQQLFLPVRASNTSIVRPSSVETVSGSDEYESPDEQPTHEPLYMDMTVNPVLDAFDSSTPVENSGWNTDADNSTVFFPGGNVALDTKTKDIPLHIVEDVVNCQPVIASTPAVEEAAPVAYPEEEHPKESAPQEADCVNAILTFARTGIRNSQPFSPSSGSEIESSVLESVEDTIAATIDNQPMPEVEVDLASQFEKLVLSKQPSAEANQATVSVTLQEGEEMPSLVLNQSVSLDAEGCEERLHHTIPLAVEGCEEPMDLEVSLETERNKLQENVDLNTVTPLATSATELSSEGKPSETESKLLPLPEDANLTNSEHLFDGSVASASPCLKGSISEQPFHKPCSLPEDKPIVPKKGYDLSFLEKFDNLENATPSFSHAKLPIPSTALSTIQPSFTPESTPSELMKEASQKFEFPESGLLEASTSLGATFSDGSENKVALESTNTPDEAVPAGCRSAAKINDQSVQETSNEVVEETASKVKSAIPSSETAETSAEDQQPHLGKADKSLDDGMTKKAPATRKPIRPKFQRPAGPAGKPDTFEIEFKFNPDDDPFKPKSKLGSSPNKEEASAFGQSAFDDNFPSLEANSTINATDGSISNEANNTVIDTMAEQHSGLDSITAKVGPDHVVDQEEEFRPAQEVFRDASDLDFLMQHGGSSQEIALARQSLFVKFDPLVGGRPSVLCLTQSNGAADETIVVEEPSTGRKSTGESLFLFSPPRTTDDSGGRTEKKEKGPGVQPQPPIIDCTMSTASRMVADDVVGIHEHREALKRQELLFQDKLLQKDREIQSKQNENQQLKAKAEEGDVAQNRLKQIVSEYETTISQLIADKEREKASMETTLQNTIKEKDEAIEDLKEVERAFSEFHRMYERNRAATESLQRNEEVLKKTVTSFQEKLQKEQQKYETLKLQSAEKLDKALQEMDSMKRTLEAESSQVKALLKKTEMRVASLETTLEQKSKENQELTKLCDELITRLGTGAK